MSSDGTQGPVLIEGITTAYQGNEPPMRLELRDMFKVHPDQWHLYLLGLERFQGVSEEHPLSYFQIAGIHGKPAQKWPNEMWNSAADKDLKPNQGYGGYCTHSSILFLTWHRVYLALFEKELYKHVNDIAKEFEENGEMRYIEAAKTFRIPYWDWARPDLPLFPAEAVSTAEHSVERPNGKLVKINPLASYVFQDYSKGRRDRQEADFPQILQNRDKTSRTIGNIDNKEVRAEMRKFFTEPERGIKGLNLAERLLFLLQSYTDFAAVSNNSELGSKKDEFFHWGSIEDVHNAVHDYIGGNMGFPAISAFDPIFWLHHTNIDRIFAIWQVCNPGKYVTPQKSKRNNIVRATNMDEDVNSSLPPFARSVTADGQQTFWTSVGVEDTKTFGYLYPETRPTFNSRKAIINELDRVYWKRASFGNILRSQPKDIATLEQLQERARVHLKKSPDTGVIELPQGRDVSSLMVKGRYLEWLVNIRADKTELSGNYIVNVFLGDPSSKTPPLLYMRGHAHVGSFATFGQDEHSPCENCKKGRSEKQRITGQIPLTIALVERYLAGQVDSLKPQHVVQYLKDNLRWKITLPTGELKSTEEMKNLLICVVSNEVTIDEKDPEAIPEYANEVTPYPEITHHIPGSFGTGYDGNNY
ncbi:hypothetical protein BDP55DRAFT_645836 [Colletotrichum godetiae]|uniref:tyrosinase n=1 Tax=Colletotrichum godetiae TaxID=1209918 RepID=A0AAJ0AXE4_9PEZI|nr:uncharacterized protein BDP55DRAFT_645836 [Colletotrichum godetiae]KAK1700074.1 hypothetical protein BDP55DRAFT_645836 [Colletotrichum godetiae]